MEMRELMDGVKRSNSSLQLRWWADESVAGLKKCEKVFYFRYGFW